MRWWSAALAALVLGAIWGCADEDPPRGGPSSTATAGSPPPANASAAPPAVAAAAAAPQGDPNPLKLPKRVVKLDPGRRVFTFSDSMLSGARLGSTLILYAANVTGFDGDDLIIEGRAGPSYKVHAGYVIPVPDDAKLKHGDAVLTEWNGVMKHGVVTKLARDKVSVRYTDMDPKTAEGQLKNARFVRQVDGLAPGNYAALRDGEIMRHVLLVSPVVEGESKRWFCLGFGGAAAIVEEALLTPIPVKYKPRPNAAVLAEWVGTLRKATVVAVEEPAQFTVRFERAGRPVTLGWGLLLPDPEVKTKK